MWTHAIQTCVVQGPSVYLFCLLISSVFRKLPGMWWLPKIFIEINNSKHYTVDIYRF